VGGIILGCTGLAATVANIAALHSLPNLVYLAYILYVLASCYVLLYAFRTALLPTEVLKRELSSPAMISSYQASLVGVGLLGRSLANSEGLDGNISQNFAFFLIYFFFIVNLLLMLRFFYCVFTIKSGRYKRTEARRGPEPYWFPGVISEAAWGWTGVAVGMPQVIIDISFWLGIFFVATIFPIAVYRCIRNPNKVAPNPSIAVLQAPAPFLALHFFATGGNAMLTESQNTVMIHVLCILTIFGQLATVFCILQRRDKLTRFHRYLREDHLSCIGVFSVCVCVCVCVCVFFKKIESVFISVSILSIPQRMGSLHLSLREHHQHQSQLLVPESK
jgi:hypothetical protein